jgi:multiple sugar transport system permease protein
MRTGTIRTTFKGIKFQTLLGKIIALALLSAGAVVVLMPIVWMMSTSLKSKTVSTEFPPRWIPMDVKKMEIDGRDRFIYAMPVEGEVRELVLLNKRGPIGNFANPDNLDELYELEIQTGERIYEVQFHWENYQRAVTTVPFSKYVVNSLIYVVSTTIGTVLSCTIVAYGFARFRARGLNLLFLLLLATIMLPPQVTLIPQFVLFSKMGWYNTFWPLIAPAFFANAWNVFLLRQYFMTVPLELDDAARIDGCGPLGILWNVILPQSLPAMATVAIFHSLWAWNDYYYPLIYLQDNEKYTVSLGLQQFNAIWGGGKDMTGMMAASTLALLPCILLFFFAQRLFIQGVVISGIKG